jgi:predicted HTH transcriptional regulator
MSYYSDSQLEVLLDDLESDLAERKESWTGDAKSKARQAVCAFANDLPNHGTPGFTDYRNPNLAGLLREMGFAQRFGAGIATARRECERNGNPAPEFDVQDAFIRVTLRPATAEAVAP